MSCDVNFSFVFMAASSLVSTDLFLVISYLQVYVFEITLAEITLFSYPDATNG